jgi:diguanylate cyclase (GGDEF)-like protein
MSHVTVIYLDLDNFKDINDTFGHLAGDQLLLEFSKRLLNATRGCDTVARLGGDEFAVLLEGLPRDDDAMPVPK